MAKMMGMQPKAQAIAPAQIALQEQQTALLTQQRISLERQDAAQQAATTQTTSAFDSKEGARLKRLRGRVSLLNDDVGIELTPTPADLQRRLGG